MTAAYGCAFPCCGRSINNRVHKDRRRSGHHEYVAPPPPEEEPSLSSLRAAIDATLLEERPLTRGDKVWLARLASLVLYGVIESKAATYPRMAVTTRCRDIEQFGHDDVSEFADPKAPYFVFSRNPAIAKRHEEDLRRRGERQDIDG